MTRLTLAERLNKALVQKPPRRCPFVSGPRRGKKRYKVPPELRGLAALYSKLLREQGVGHWRRQTYADTERPQMVEFLLAESLRCGRHCPAGTVTVEFHRSWVFTAS